MNKERILLIISLLALIASGWILYSSFGGTGFGITIPWIQQTEPTVAPVQQAINNVQAFDSQIQRSLNNLGPKGIWETLLNSDQYKFLSDKALVPIDIGEHTRTNPFVPTNLSNTTNAQQ